MVSEGSKACGCTSCRARICGGTPRYVFETSRLFPFPTGIATLLGARGVEPLPEEVRGRVAELLAGDVRIIRPFVLVIAFVAAERNSLAS
jgi:hypothetical protein